MRSLFLIALVLTAVSCSKNKSVARDVGGDYMMVKSIKEDGSQYTKQVKYTFEDAALDGKTFTGWSSYDPDSGAEQSGSYCVTGKGVVMIFRTNTEFGPVTDTAKIEDADKKSMVIRNSQGLNYFQKINPK